MANEIQPGSRTFSLGTSFLFQLYYEDPFPLSLDYPTSCLLSWLLLSLSRSKWHQIFPNLWFPSTGKDPALLCFHLSWAPYHIAAILLYCASAQIWYFKSTNQCHLEQDYAAISCYCPRNQKKTETAKQSEHMNTITQLRPYTERTVTPQREKKKHLMKYRTASISQTKLSHNWTGNDCSESVL